VIDALAWLNTHRDSRKQLVSGLEVPGEIASHRLDDQELIMLALHLLQACLVYVNTLMLQQVLTEPTWLTAMTPADFRALTPLIYHHVNPYGVFELDLDKRLAIGQPTDVLAA
jgi:hypothetical protein